MTSASQYGAHAEVYVAEKRRTRTMVDGEKAGYLEKLRAGDIGYSWVRSSDTLLDQITGWVAASCVGADSHSPPEVNPLPTKR